MSQPRYGIWIPVYGNCGAMNHPIEPRDASYANSLDTHPVSSYIAGLLLLSSLSLSS